MPNSMLFRLAICTKHGSLPPFDERKLLGSLQVLIITTLPGYHEPVALLAFTVQKKQMIPPLQGAIGVVPPGVYT